MRMRNHISYAKTILRNEPGTAAVEMALMFPIFLCVASGILAFGIDFGAVHSTQQIAADAARILIAAIDPAERTSLPTTDLQQNANKYPLIRPEHVSIPASTTNHAEVVASVVYDASVLPIRGLGALVPLPSKMIARTSVIRQGGSQ